MCWPDLVGDDALRDLASLAKDPSVIVSAADPEAVVEGGHSRGKVVIVPERTS